MIQLTGAGKRYGPRILFENTDWLVTPNERAGIVGANGTGKSSLLKVLAGIEGLDSGVLTTQKGVTLGYLPQEGLSLSGRTVFAECMTVFADLRALEEEQEDLAHRMAELDPVQPRIRPGGRPLPPRRRRISRARRLRHRSAGGHRAHRPRLSAARLETPHRGVLGRLADAHRARQTAARKAQSAAARRAHQPSRPGSPQLARRVSGLLPQCLRAGLARPLFSRRHGPQDRRAVEQEPALLHRRLLPLRSAEDRAARATCRRPTPTSRTGSQQLEAFINRFRAQATKAKQVQSRIKELEKIERIEIPPEEKTIHFSFPAAQAERPRSWRSSKGLQELWRPHGVFRTSTSSSNAATGSRWWASTAPANPP